MVDAVASEVGAIILHKLIYGVLKEVQSILNVNSEVENLKETQLTITALLLDAENIVCTTQVQRVVLDRLTCALERMDDFLKGREHRAMRKRIMRNRPVHKVLLWFLSPSSNPIIWAIRDRIEVKDIRAQLDRIAKDSHFGNIISEPSDLVRQTWTPTSSTGPYIDSKEVIGRDRDRDKILSMIVDSTDTLFVLPLVGICGIGKTTLAQFVYNNEWVENHYDLRLWVCVPQVFNFEEVVRKMVEFLTQESLHHCDMAQLQTRLLPLICGNKCLIVLDNVWDHTSLSINWQGLKSLLSLGGAAITVLITTRSDTVARLMCTVDPYGLGGLKAEDSWHLFERVVSKQLREPRFEEIGKTIVRMCPNVPLVIHAMGCLLRGLDTIDSWEDFRDQLACETLCGRVPSVMEMLKLSYDQLHPNGLKLCFLYCSLFPKGFQLEKDKFIYMCLALGYIETPRQENKNLVDVAEDYLGRLKDLGLIDLEEFKGVEWCLRMPHPIHDLAISLAKSKYKMVDDIGQELGKRIQHVSFSKVAELSGNFPCSSLFEIKKHVRSIHVLQRACKHPELTLKGLSKFEYLTVFSLQNVGLEEVPAGILCKLIHLGYIDLSGNKFRELPKEITQLTNLLYLNLSYCEELQELPEELGRLEKLLGFDLSNCDKLKKLPGNISKLTNLHLLDLRACKSLQELPSSIIECVKLRHLRLGKCLQLEHMPVGLGNLTHLQTLDWFVTSGQSSSSINSNSPNECRQSHTAGDHFGRLSELNGLNNLRGRLTILVDGRWSSVAEAMEANLQAKERLTHLHISFNGGSRKDNEIMLQAFQPHANLESLRISKYRGETLPSWLNGQDYLPKVKRLRISGTEVHRYLGSLGRLPKLEHMNIEMLPKQEIIENTATMGPSNESMKAYATADEANPNLDSQTNADTPPAPLFPSLAHLIVHDRAGAEGWGRPNSSSEWLLLGAHETANAFPQLKRFELHQSELEVVPKMFQEAPALKILWFFNCRKLKEIPDWIGNLQSLESLFIWDCPQLTSLPKRIANLEKLKAFNLTGCPTLEERCRKPSGEDWPLIQHVCRVMINFKRVSQEVEF